VIGRFPTATADLVALRELRCRSDTKFVLAPSAVAELLHRLWPHYALLPAAAGPFGSYQTLYFDTGQLDLFHAQRRGKRLRHKVRIRHYEDRQMTSLEVKTRSSDLRTFKTWRERPYGDNQLSPDDRAFIETQTGLSQPVVPQVWTRYRRLMLLGIHSNERISLDLDLRVEMGSRARSFDQLAILEVKQWPFCRSTPVMTALRAAGSHPAWAGKYCTGIAFTHPGVRLSGLRFGLRNLEGVTRCAS
jgi:hypothetical protein